MRVEVFANDFNLSAALRRYASARVWLAVHRFADRLSWVGARFTGDPGQNGRPRVTCQIDVWVKGAGVVTVRHTDTNPYVGVDCAAVRLRQTLASRLRHADDMARRPGAAAAAENNGGAGEGINVGLSSGNAARPHLLAECVWENEGGGLKHSRRLARPAGGRHRTTRRSRHDVSDHGRHNADHPKAGQGSPPRDAIRGLPGLRPNPARLARS
jgi:hypothetical protein